VESLQLRIASISWLSLILLMKFESTQEFISFLYISLQILLVPNLLSLLHQHYQTNVWVTSIKIKPAHICFTMHEIWKKFVSTCSYNKQYNLRVRKTCTHATVFIFPKKLWKIQFHKSCNHPYLFIHCQPTK